MTKGTYRIYQALRQFGYNPSTRLLSQATSELQLMNQAIELLGYYNAEFVEEVDDLRSDHWLISKLREQVSQLGEEQAKIQTNLEAAINEKNSLSEEDEQTVIALKAKLKETLINQNSLIEDRNLILAEGRRVRRFYDGLLMEKQQLETDAHEHAERIETLKRKIDEAALKLSTLKKRIDATGRSIERTKNEVKDLEDEIETFQLTISEEVLQSYADVGSMNQQLSALQSQSSLLEGELTQKIIHVGRYLFANSHKKEISRCVKKHRELLFQIQALKRSITLIHQFCDRRMAR